MIKIKKDKRNTNKHTEEGLELLDKSIDNVGIIESYTISNDNVIISGNARHEKISNKFKKEPIVIETDGTEPIIIKRTDIESNTKKFHEASILANTTAHKNFNLDNELIEEISVEYDIDLEDLGVDYLNDNGDIDYSFQNSEIDSDFSDIQKAKELDFTDKYILIRFKDNEQYKDFVIKNNVKLEKSPNFKKDNNIEIERKVIFDYEDLHTI